MLYRFIHSVSRSWWWCSTMAYAGVPSTAFSSVSLSNSNPSIFLSRYNHSHLNHFPKRTKSPAICVAHAGVTMKDFFANDDVSAEAPGQQTWDTAQYQALLNGGEQVTSVLEEMIKLVSLRSFFLLVLKLISRHR